MNPYTVAEETLGQSSMQRNLPGMVSKVQPGPQALQDPLSLPNGNYQQLASNERLKRQEMSRNIETAGPQANVGATQDFRKQGLDQSNSESKAQKFAAERMSEMLYANQSGNALMQLNETMGGPDRAKFLNEIATGKALASGLSADLGAEAANKARYIR